MHRVGISPQTGWCLVKGFFREPESEGEAREVKGSEGGGERERGGGGAPVRDVLTPASGLSLRLLLQ